MTAHPVINHKMTGASVNCNCNNPAALSNKMIAKIIVVAPMTAVPISTGFAVALKVFQAPSFSSSICLPCSKSGLNPYFFSI